MKIFTLIITAALIFTAAFSAPAQRKRSPAKPRPKAGPAAGVKLGTPPVSGIDPALAATGPADADGWKTYRGTPGDFRISFPGAPVAVLEKGTDARDAGTAKYYVPDTVAPGAQTFSLFVISLQQPIDDADAAREFYTAWLKAAREPADGTSVPLLVQDKETAAGNRAALEVILEQGSTRLYAKVLIVGDKFYQLMASSEKAAGAPAGDTAAIEKNAQKFLASLRVPEPPKLAAASITADPIYGKFEDGVYTNTVIGFSLTPPAGWVLGDITPDPARRAAAMELLKTDDPAHNADIDRSAGLEKTVFRAYRKALGSPNNASMGISTAKLPPNYGTLDANTLLTRTTLEKSPLNPTIAPTRAKFFGKVKANILDMDSTVSGTRIKQRMYLFSRRGYALTIVFSGVDEIDLAVLEAAAATLKFD